MSGPGRVRVLAVAGAVAFIVLAVVVGDRARAQADLTQDRTLTLAEPSLEIARAVDEPTRVTAFLSRQEPGRSEAAALLDRYRRENRRISYRLTDPADAPGELRRLGVDPVLGGIAVEQGDRIERGPTASEQDVSAALARLARDVDDVVCFTASHGERPVSDASDGMAALGELLQENGYRVRVGPSTYDGCSVAVVAAPTADLADGDRLVEWLADGGRALVLTDPESTADVDAVVGPFGIAIRRGVVTETNSDGHVPGDPATPIVSSYRSGFPFVRRLPPTLYPGAQAVEVAPRAPEGVAAAVVASTTSGGVLRTAGDPAAGASASEGAVALVAAADRSRVVEGRVVRSRVVVTGDVDFASNAFLAELGHERLAVQAIDWLALREDLVSVSANVARPRPLLLTPSRLTYLRVLTAGIVPLAFLLAGAGLWAVRRAR